MLNVVPDLSRLTTAARNAWALSVGGGVQPPEPTPSETVHSEEHRTLLRFGRSDAADADPVLLVPPLAVHWSCYDLRPDQSLIRFLLDIGRRVYVVDYGDIDYSDRNMGFEDWIDDIIPGALRRVSQDSGDTQVDVVAWSLGGTLSLLTAAADPELPIRSITVIGTPIDYHKNPSVNLLRLFGRLTDSGSVATVTKALGGVPAPFVQAGFRATAIQREITRPWFIARNLHNTETLARMESIDRFMGSMPGYPARLYTQMHKRLIIGNELARGGFRIGRRKIDLRRVNVPVLAIGGTTDVIAPLRCVRHITAVLPGSPKVRFETAPGSHLGVLTGTEARHTTWAHLGEFLASQRPDDDAADTGLVATS